MTRSQRIYIWQALLVLLAVTAGPDARPSDACSTVAVSTSADVAASDGSTFSTRSYFQTADFAAIQHVDESIVAVEGPFGWAQSGQQVRTGEPFYKTFALGHQYHALLLNFDDIVSGLRRTTEIRFGDASRSGTTGDYPYGGAVHLVDGDDEMRPAGLVFEFPDTPAITADFLDWRPVDGTDLPYRIRIDDGRQIFDYRYTRIDIAPKPPTWFFDAVPAPPDDAVQIQRLHRRLLAAHCLGDADLIATLSAADIVIASRGELTGHSNATMREQFKQLFARLEYTAYKDIEPPIVEVSDGGDLGWIGVNVRATGSDRETGAGFDDQWAWIMIAKKIDGEWLHVANASNVDR